MIDPITISVLASLATEGGKFAIKKILKSDELETQVSQAYESALQKWSKNTDVRRREKLWTTKRLNQLLDYLKNPTDDYLFNKSTKILIDNFYSELQKKDTAWRYIQGEHFKTEITKLNSISDHLEDLVKELKEKKLNSTDVIKALKNQTLLQIEKQISTEKYIPKTFIETDELKDQIRCFVDPFTFYPKIINEAKSLDFSHLIRINKLNDNDIFEYDINNFEFDVQSLSTEELFIRTDENLKYLNDKYNEIENIQTNLSYTFGRKLKSPREAFEYIKSKVLLLTDNAGQGKTNLVCDIAQNVLLKKEIPTIFLTGYEVNANNINESISKRIFPNDNYTLNEILNTVSEELVQKQLVIIIDGINENSKLFSKNLEKFIESIIDKSFIKIILTCRTEYFKYNFNNLIESSFKKNIKMIEELNSRLNYSHKEQLLDAYFNHFNIKIDYLHKEIKKLLVDNFLLLRIFCEVNKNKHIPNVDNIYKTDLFVKYYNNKIEEINKRLKNNDDFNIKGNFDIKNFIEMIASYMVNNKTFNNIPINELIKKDNYREVYIRFLDENIILKKDLEQKTDSIFVENEVVNFTYDEFRDFIIADYLITKLYKLSKENFIRFLEENFNKESTILEGTSVFLYSLSRKLEDYELKKLIKKQEWYNNAYLNVVFNTADKEITKDDKVRLMELFTTDQSIAENIIIELAYRRYDVEKYDNLNIKLLFEIFNSLSSEEFEQFVYNGYKGYGNSIKQLIEKLEEFLENFKNSYHNLFKYLLFLLPLTDKVGFLYLDYYSVYENKQQIKDLLNCNNEKLIKAINQFMTNYDIQL